jgi:hypothetical protein
MAGSHALCARVSRAAELKSGSVHALAMRCWTPTEWQSNGQPLTYAEAKAAAAQRDRSRPPARTSPIVAQEVPLPDDAETPGRRPFELSESIRGPLAGFVVVVLLSGALSFLFPQLLEVLPASARAKVEAQMAITGPFVFVVPGLVLFRLALFNPAVAEGLGLANGDIKLSKKPNEWREWK